MNRLFPFLAGLLFLALPLSSALADPADVQEDELLIAATGQGLIIAQTHLADDKAQLSTLETTPLANASQIAALLADEATTQLRIDTDLAVLTAQGGDLAVDWFGGN